MARQEKLTSVSASMSTIYKDMEEHTKVRSSALITARECTDHCSLPK